MAMPVHSPPSPFRERLRAVGHFMTGLAILMKGISKLDHGSHDLPFTVLFLAAGLGVIVMTALHQRRAISGPRFEVLLYAVESLVSFVLAWYFFHEGKTYLPYAALVPAAVFAVLAVVMWRKKSQGHEAG